MTPTGTVDVGGFELRYRVEGTGHPVMVVGDTNYYPRIFSQNLRKHLRLVFVEHRGMARATRESDESSARLATVASDTEQVRRQLDLHNVVVVGHSGQAFMALEYAKAFPENVTHVVMIGIAPDLGPASAAMAERRWNESVSPERKRCYAKALEALPDDALTKLPFSEMFIATMKRNGAKSWFNPNFDSTPLWDGVELNQVFGAIWGSVFPTIDVTRNLEALDCPVLLALGRYDCIVAPAEAWDPLRPAFKNLTVRVFERSGHTPPLEEPELFDSELLTWLRDHS